MANMFPSNIEDYNATESEKYFYNQLKNKLSCRFSVFYSVRWFAEVNGQRVNSECDFLIFHPSFGYITVEVKGGKDIQKNGDKWRLLYDNGYRELNRSPFNQAEESMYYFLHYYEEQFNHLYRGVYGSAVAFPFYSINGDFGPEGPRSLFIDYGDIENLEKKIMSIFQYWRGKNHNFISFSSDQQVKFINMVNKRIALSAAAGSLIGIREKKLEEINRVQENYIELLMNYRQAFIIGGAGTGKTWIAMKKAERQAIDGEKVLIICYNKALRESIKNNLQCKNIDVFTFHSLVSNIIGQKEYNKIYMNSKELKGISKVFNKYINLPKYDSILVDEAQDFNEEWAYCICSLLRDSEQSILYVFYDENQNIFNRKFGNAFMINSPPFLLTENLRNTATIHKWIVKQTGLGSVVKPNLIEGAVPERISIKNSKNAVKKLEEILRTLIKKEKVKKESIVVLSNRSIENSILKDNLRLGVFKFVTEDDKLQENCIKYKTLQSYKGLESDIVIYLNHESSTLEQLYVAYTRARFYLYEIEIIE